MPFIPLIVSKSLYVNHTLFRTPLISKEDFNSEMGILQVILIVGAKLQMIITKMGLRVQDRGDVVRGAPVVEPGDELFWFNRPRLILFLINFVLFQVLKLILVYNQLFVNQH